MINSALYKKMPPPLSRHQAFVRTAVFALFYAMPFWLFGCSPTLDLANYSTTCATDDDCTLIIAGDVCTTCPTSAANKSDAKRAGIDAQQLRKFCAGILECDPGFLVPECRDGKCQAIGHERPYLDGGPRAFLDA